MDGWNTTFLLGRPIFRGYVSFREGILGGNVVPKLNHRPWWGRAPLLRCLGRASGGAGTIGSCYVRKSQLGQPEKKCRCCHRFGWCFVFWGGMMFYDVSFEWRKKDLYSVSYENISCRHIDMCIYLNFIYTVIKLYISMYLSRIFCFVSYIFSLCMYTYIYNYLYMYLLIPKPETQARMRVIQM